MVSKQNTNSGSYVSDDQISLTLPVDLCLYMGFLIAWRIVCSRASPGEL